MLCTVVAGDVLKIVHATAGRVRKASGLDDRRQRGTVLMTVLKVRDSQSPRSLVSVEQKAVTKKTAIRVRLYVDESGDHSPPCSDEIRHRYLTLAGVAIDLNTEAMIASDLEALKRRHFECVGDRTPVLHRVDIVNYRGPFAVLRDEARKEAFGVDLLDFVASVRFRAFAVVVDKASHFAKKYRRTAHPYHYAAQALLERYVGRLLHLGNVGDVVAEGRGKREDKLFSAAYDSLYSGGTRFMSAEQTKAALTSKKLKFERKGANVAGLQLADILAYPMTRDVLRASNLPCGQLSPFTEKLLQILEAKYNRQIHQSRVGGYGRVLLD